MRYLLLILLLLAAVMPIAAQQEIPCEIDVTDAITALEEAQTAADEGDAETAIAALASAQTALRDLRAACRSQLPNTFVSDTLFSIDYPDGWTAESQSPTGGEGAIFEEVNPANPLPSNLTPLTVIVGPARDVALWSGIVDMQAFDAALAEEGAEIMAVYEEALAAGSPNIEMSNIAVDAVEILEQQAVILHFNAVLDPEIPELEAELYIIELVPDELYAMLAGITLAGEMGDLQGIMSAMAATLTLK